MTKTRHHWQPANRERHAFAGRPGSVIHQPGVELRTLCDQTVHAAESTELTWLWPTCLPCLQAAKRLNGFPEP